MHNVCKLLIVLATIFVVQNTYAQPPARKNDKKAEQKEVVGNINLTERAKSQYPVNTTPQEVDWKREIYRAISLENEINASLYYPVEPMGDSMNLFTLLFNNILNGNITAYTYNLDGYESFIEENIVDPRTMLENYRIYYEENGGVITVGKSDIPSAEVLSYYVKESHYYDQRSGTYGKHITAICPVLHRSGEYSSEVTKYPMFWLKYEDIATYLAQQSIMTSSLNNASAMTIDDFFKKGCYDGEIYKTVNTRNLAIAQYCKDSVSVKQEQEKIEKQLSDFKENLWSTKTIAEIKQDSINAAKSVEADSVAEKETIAQSKKPTLRAKTDSGANKAVSVNKENKVKKSSVKQPKERKPQPVKSNSGTVSVRRERR